MRAAHLGRSRASPEVTLGRDAPAPAKKASPEDSRRRLRQVQQGCCSPEERAQKCLAGGPGHEGRNVWPMHYTDRQLSDILIRIFNRN